MFKLWIKLDEKDRIENDKLFAEYHVVEEDYDQIIKFLAGEKHKEPHIHFGVNLTQHSNFFEDRGIVKQTQTTIESKEKGLILNEINPLKIDIDNHFKLNVIFTIKCSTGEVSIDTFEFENK